ncbi:MAG: heavy metal translocating P-type ATPase [Bacteroidales bacterium]|nr:heavy metal translocating P-type ATPase [Bacteroidales bacterium]
MSHHHLDNECCHEHHHEHHHEELGNKIIIIIATVILLVAAVIVEKKFNLKTWQLLLVYLVPYLLVGWETLKEAAEGLLKGEPFNEHFLMAVATIGALCIGFLPGAESQFPEAVVVMLFFQIGELFEGYAEGQSRKSIAHLMDIRPDRALVERDGVLVETSPENIAIGETIVVKAGEKIPLDGIVSEGSSSLDTKALTGESMPREATVGDQVISGCINLSGVLKIRTVKSFKESTVSKILDLVENAQDKKSRSEAFITRFAKVYTPIVVFAAIILAFLPPIISGNFSQIFPTWLYRALMFLVVSCPCALVISVPLTFFGGIGGASRKGILIKGANCLDILSDVKTVVFDKTGTLTQGKFAVEAIHPDTCEDDHHTGECQQSHLGDSVSDRLIHLASHVEHFSTHPIAGALRDAFPAEATDGCQVTDIEEIAGQGAKAKVGNDLVYVGNSKLMESIGVKWHQCNCTGTIIHIAINGEYSGHIVINDQIKEDSISAISNLKALGVSQCVMLTGDHKDVARQIAEKLNLTKYYAELLPDDKVQKMESIITENKDGKTAFVGDGINDAPVLARADIGIAMGALGSDAAIEAADVVLMDDKPSKIATAIRIARRTLSIAKQNIWFAIAIKVAVLILAALGIATMWMAVFADVGVTVLAVLNAMRALRS